MPKQTEEQREVEDFIRASAAQAQNWQRQITENEPLENWVKAGHWSCLKVQILDALEMDAFRTIKNPAFDPTDFSQVAQWKALCQTIDLIKSRIDQRLATMADARIQLQKLEIESTQTKEGD